MSIPFIDRLSISVQGNVTSNAICLADVDDDECFELCVGDSRGTLSIYKELNREPWNSISKLGHIVAISCGDLCNQGKNVLIVISADGHCRLFDFNLSEMSPPPIQSSPYEDSQYSSSVSNVSNGSKCSEEGANRVAIKPCFYQRLPPNVKQAQIAGKFQEKKTGMHQSLKTAKFMWKFFREEVFVVDFQMWTEMV